MVKHGLDFADLDIEFFAGSMVVPANDDRFTAIGELDGQISDHCRRRVQTAWLRSYLRHFNASRQSQGKEALMVVKFSPHRPLKDDEEAEIQKMIASDPDAPEATDEQLHQAKPFSKAFPDLMESIKRSRGRPKLENAKVAVTLRIDPDVLEQFQSKGRDWRSDMTKALRKAAGL